MIPIRKFTLKDDSGFENFVFSNLTSFTVFLGQNNSGKTRILNHIYDFCKNECNYLSMDEINYLFSDRDVGVNSKIKKIKKEAQNEIIYKFNQSNDKTKKIIFKYMKYLTNITLDYHEGEFNHFTETKNDVKYHLDIQDIGSAYVALFAALVYILWNNNPILIVDEPELGLHAEMQKKLFKVLKNISKISGFQVFIATHSHLFLDREHPKNNFKIKIFENSRKISRLNSEKDIYFATYQMLGNSPGDIFMPSNFILCEGISDKIFLVKLMNRFYKEKIGTKKIVIQPSRGDIVNKQIPRTLSGLERLYSILDNNSMYQNRAVILVDKQNHKMLKRFKTKYKLSHDRLRSLGEINKYALEDAYPASVITRIARKEHIKIRNKSDIRNLVKKIKKNKKSKKVQWAKMIGDEIRFDEVPRIFKEVIKTAIKLSL